MRCLALAQAWKQEGGDAAFLCSHEGHILRERVLGEGFQWITIPESYPAPVDLETTLPVLSGLCTSQGKWVVLDGYHFDEIYQSAVRNAGHRILLIDDMGHLSRYHADILLNQNTPPGILKYHTDPETRLLQGNRYVFLRHEFLNWKGKERRHPHVAENILVSMGGADPDNVTRIVIDALKRLALPRLSVRVVVGASNPHRDSLEQSASSAGFECRLVDATDRMPELMAWADVAVSAGGTTCWEMAFMGLPNLVVVLAENQKAVIGPLRSAGCSEILEDRNNVQDLYLMLDGLVHARQRRKDMSQRGHALIDGLGSRRVVKELLCMQREYGGEGK